LHQDDADYGSWLMEQVTGVAAQALLSPWQQSPLKVGYLLVLSTCAG